jgi:hypothetical protein
MKKSAWKLSNLLLEFQNRAIVVMVTLYTEMRAGIGMFLAILMLVVLSGLEWIGSRPFDTSFGLNQFDLSTAIADFQANEREKES